MAGPIALANSCCSEPCSEPTSIGPPGPAGSNGAPGADGEDGISPVTSVAAQFLMPAEGANVTVAVGNSQGLVPGQIAYVQTAGYMEVVSKPNSISVILKNLENTASSLYTTNAAPTTAIPVGSLVSAGGVQGPAGNISGAAGGHLKGTYPNPTLNIGEVKGMLIVGDGTNAQELSVGTNGNSLEADSTQPLGVKWAPKNLAGGANHVTGATPIANGGTGQTTRAAAMKALAGFTTRGDLLVRDSADDAVPLPLGAVGTVLQSDGSDPVYAKLTAANFGSALGIIPLDYIRLDDAAGGGVNGGTFTAGSWLTRAITQEHADTGNHCTLAANQFTLAAGTYRIKATAVGYKCDNHQIRLMNITEATVYGYGTNARSAAADDVATESHLEMRFTIGGARVFEVQHQCSATRATDGWGAGNAFGGAMRYTSVEIWREVA